MHTAQLRGCCVELRVSNSYLQARGPFDIIGDIHGCYTELRELLDKLGWRESPNLPHPAYRVPLLSHPENRKAVFLGDLVDRGPGILEVLQLAMSMVESGNAICLLGNHDDKLMRKLMGRKVTVSHGLADTLAQLSEEPPAFTNDVFNFLSGLSTYQILDEGRLVVAHAGIKEAMIGGWNDRIRAFTIYGDTTGESDEYGLPVRLDWAADYAGEAMIVYGHTPIPRLRWVNNTINIDTGCVFGGSLTALRYPEKELLSVPAHSAYAERAGGIR